MLSRTYGFDNTVWPPVPGKPAPLSSDTSPARCPRISSWKLFHNAAMVSYSRVMPRTSSSFRFSTLLEDSSSSKPYLTPLECVKSGRWHTRTVVISPDNLSRSLSKNDASSSSCDMMDERAKAATGGYLNEPRKLDVWN